MTAPVIPLSASAVEVQMNVAQATHGLTAGQAIYIDSTGAYKAARSNALGTLAHDVISTRIATTTGTFTLASDGEIITGATGLTIGDPVHCSAATAGAIVTASQGTAPASAVAQNVLGIAISATSWRVTRGYNASAI